MLLQKAPHVRLKNIRLILKKIAATITLPRIAYPPARGLLRVLAKNVATIATTLSRSCVHLNSGRRRA